jgi:hypothetical protein
MSMDGTWNTVTQELDEAEELWKREAVDKSVYECPGCPIPVYPASYKQTNH